MYRISVDVGGTFTDVVVADADGKLTLGKALTTPDRSFDGFYAGLEDVAAQLGMAADEILSSANVLIYGTTRATNAVVEAKTAKTAFLVTKGFSSTLLYRQGGKEHPFKIDMEWPKPYVPRKYTFEIEERINAEAGIETDLDEEQTRQTLRQLKRINIEAVAVCFIWSTINAKHEQRVGELIEEELPGVPYTLSSQLNPVIREYARASSTCIDASLKPLMQSHLTALRSDLETAGFSGELLISTSAGGVLHIGEVIERPIYTVKSGPAMAPLAGRTYAEAEQLGKDVVILDTGGTTFDVSLVRDGFVKYTRETWFLGKWIGHNLGMSTVDVRSIGAGGGSIAWVDSGGLLKLGPESAGSVPGPACYGRGGEKPTVTDAAVVLGYIDPEFFGGGRMKLDRDAALAAMRTVADKLGMSVEETAFGILRLAGEQMIKAIEGITVNDGINPRESIMVAGGGAAGLNVMPIAAALGCKQVLLPNLAGGLSACGAQYSDIVVEHSTSQYAHTGNFDFEAVRGALKLLTDYVSGFGDELAGKGVEEQKLEFFVEARYERQLWEIDIPLPLAAIETDDDVNELITAFHNTHERLYSVREEGAAVECLNWKVRLTAFLKKPAPVSSAEVTEYTPDPDRIIESYFGKAGLQSTPVYLGNKLNSGALIEGPAIIEEPTTTIVVYPEMLAEVTAGKNYLLHTIPVQS